MLRARGATGPSRARLGRPRGHVPPEGRVPRAAARGAPAGRDEGPASSALNTRPSQGLEGRHRIGARAARLHAGQRPKASKTSKRRRGSRL